MELVAPCQGCGVRSAIFSPLSNTWQPVKCLSREHQAAAGPVTARGSWGSSGSWDPGPVTSPPRFKDVAAKATRGQQIPRCSYAGDIFRSQLNATTQYTRVKNTHTTRTLASLCTYKDKGEINNKVFILKNEVSSALSQRLVLVRSHISVS